MLVVVCWIVEIVFDVVLIGFDSESEQWVVDIVVLFGMFYQVLVKEWYGDYDVCVSLFDLQVVVGWILVLIDDIVLFGYIILEIFVYLCWLLLLLLLLVVIYLVFVGDVYVCLQEVGLVCIVSIDIIVYLLNVIVFGVDFVDVVLILMFVLADFLEDL